MINRRLFMGALAAGLSQPARAQGAKPPRPVVASFSILADFSREVGGERLAVTSLVGPGQDAHVYAATPGDARRLRSAAAIVVNGLNFEEPLKRLLDASGSKAPVIVASTGVPVRTAGAGHAHKGHRAHTATPDPHAWQSVPNARSYVATIAAGLTAIDPEGSDIYRSRAAAYSARLDDLDREIRSAVAAIPASRRILVTTHDAFGYFADAYGIRFIPLQGVSTETDLSAGDLARVIRAVKAEGAVAVFVENITDPRKAERLAKESGAKLGGTLYSDALTGSDGPAPSYIAMMQHNIRELTKALAL